MNNNTIDQIDKDENYCWHYTTSQKFQSIITTGSIFTEDQTTGKIEGLPGAVWFSTLQTYEPTARKGVVENGVNRTLTLEEMRLRCVLVRFGVKADCSWLLNWRQWKRICTIGSSTIKRLEEVAIRNGGNVEHYRASLTPVSLDQLDVIDIEKNGEWVRHWSKQQQVPIPAITVD